MPIRRAVIVLLTLCSSHALSAARIEIRLDDSAAPLPIADDFIGFGYEVSAIAQPGGLSADNKRMVQLYRNLGTAGMMRIGGNVSDHDQFIPDGIATAKTERETTIINQKCLDDLAAFARETHWSVMWGLNLQTGTREQAVAEALAVSKTLGSNLHSIEIGNEVDLYKKFSGHYAEYFAAYRDYKSAIRAALPTAAFSGPDSAWSLPYVQQFVDTEAADMRLATHHYYRGGAKQPEATIEHLLDTDSAQLKRLDALQKLCAEKHVGYRFNETNSFYGGGKPGVSDTFASALWCLDFMYQLAAHGCAGVNLQTDINQLGFISHYSPIAPDANGVAQAKPEYYGLLAFSLGGHGKLLPLRIENAPERFAAYATQAKEHTLWLTLINKSDAADMELAIQLPADRSKASASWLRGPALDAKEDVSFAGATVDENGTWTAGKTDDRAVTDHALHINIPHASAVVIRCD